MMPDALEAQQKLERYRREAQRQGLLAENRRGWRHQVAAELRRFADRLEAQPRPARPLL